MVRVNLDLQSQVISDWRQDNWKEFLEMLRPFCPISSYTGSKKARAGPFLEARSRHGCLFKSPMVASAASCETCTSPEQ